MDKKLIKIKQQTNAMILTWVINNICNNHCSYCPDILHTGKNHHYEWEKAKGFLSRLFSRYPKIHCSVSGGEPTLSPFFKEVVDIFYDSEHTIGITTNGARTIRYWEEIAPKLSYICFSYHPSNPDPDFIEKVKVASKQTLVTVRIMMDSRYWDTAYDMFKKCSEIDEIAVDPVRILPEIARNTNIGETYTEDQEKLLLSLKRKEMIDHDLTKVNPRWKLALIRSNYYFDDGSVEYVGLANKYITMGQNKFSGWYCSAGLESLYISYTGEIQLANCEQGGIKFHIDDHEAHELPTKGVICDQPLCFCGADFQISKEKIK